MHYESVLAALLIRLLFGWRTRDEVKAWNVSAVRLGVLAKKTPLPLSWDARTCKPCTKIPRSQATDSRTTGAVPHKTPRFEILGEISAFLA
jgi:hypothetical protein